jgi:NAD(P)-dependent dehydrogenase (short-subunit alcohol dehydrogenase family)
MLGFTEQIRAVIIGGNGGVGQEFIRQLQDLEQVESIIATHRRPLENLHPQTNDKVQWVQVDVRDESTIANLATYIKSQQIKPNLIINCIGILHTSEFGPEKTWRHLNSQTMHDVFAINAFAVALLGKHLIPQMPRQERSIFASLSARVGSIADNRLGGWYSYRASKTAHNMFVKTLSLESLRKYPKLAIVSLHPGTVETSLSEPFTARYDPNKLFTVTRSVKELSSVIAGLSSSDTGGFFAWDGQAIPY